MVPVHLGGLPCEMAPLRELAEGADIRILEDAAHAFPASEGKRPVGTLGDAAAFSFYATKNITTGEGGMLVLRDQAAAEQARILSLHGISRDAWLRYTASGSWRYQILASGYKYNLTDIASSLGLCSSRRRARSHRRRLLAARYGRALRGLDAIETPPTRAGDSTPGTST